MAKDIFKMICVPVLVLGLAFGSPVAFAENEATTDPAGWAQGEKTGWEGIVPPGQEAQNPAAVAAVSPDPALNEAGLAKDQMSAEPQQVKEKSKADKKKKKTETKKKKAEKTKTESKKKGEKAKAESKKKLGKKKAS
ncbi:MAG TPA: hypothetical protein PLL75_01800 [Candidatus Omnitrophota bacterium]|nr:hypothetical protein [Candidatus Omnitrophota bacterium]HPS36448.1 hypothetical protein [Candidatus Omnitrophota bacterium]